MQPEAHKLDDKECLKMHTHLCNYIIMLRKFEKTGWSKSFNFLQKLYTESNNLMPITPLTLHAMTITNSLLLHVLKHLTKEQQWMKEKKEKFI